MSHGAEKDAGVCLRGPDWFRCIYEAGHEDDCFGYRVPPPEKQERP